MTTLPPAAPTGTPAPSPATIRTVEIQQFAFEPSSLSVGVGTTVTWTNHDAIIHSVTSGVAPQPSGAFDSEFFDQGQTYSFTFTQPGDYPYFCKRHNFMMGEIVVVAGR